MQGLLAGLEQQMGSLDLGDCSDDELGGLVRELNRGRRELDGYLARIATIARSREHTGDGPPVDQLFGGNGDVSRTEAERQAKRGNVADDFPRSAERMHNGDALTENMDTLARLTDKLTDTERQRLTVFDQEIADRAMALAPEHFARWLTKLIRSIKDEDRPSTAEEQKKASKLNMGRRRDGMWWLSGVLDPERGAELNAAINAAARKLAGDHTPTANTRAAALHHLATNSGTGVPAKLGIGFIIDAQTLYQPPAYSHSNGTRHGTQSHAGPGNGQTGQGHDHHNGHAGPGNHDYDHQNGHGDHDHHGRPSNHGHCDGIGSGSVRVAQTWAGDDHDPAAIQRLACDADHYAILINKLGHPDRVGRTRRAATLEQRLALRALYRSCPLDGTPFDYCDIHHVNQPFEHGGSTTLDNLVPHLQGMAPQDSRSGLAAHHARRPDTASPPTERPTGPQDSGTETPHPPTGVAKSRDRVSQKALSIGDGHSEFSDGPQQVRVRCRPIRTDTQMSLSEVCPGWRRVETPAVGSYYPARWQRARPKPDDDRPNVIRPRPERRLMPLDHAATTARSRSPPRFTTPVGP